MARIGLGDWDSTAIQHAKARKAMVRLDSALLPARERLRLARKLLRNGSDLVACLVMNIFRAQLVDAERGAVNPLEPLLPALRVRALRILRQPSRQQGRDHVEALSLLALAPAAIDLPLLEQLMDDPQTKPAARQLAEEILTDLAPYLLDAS